jgi:hypothetical protein
MDCGNPMLTYRNTSTLLTLYKGVLVSDKDAIVL